MNERLYQAEEGHVQRPCGQGETDHGVNGELKEGQSGWTERRKSQVRGGGKVGQGRPLCGCMVMTRWLSVCVCVSGVAHRQMCMCLFAGLCMCTCTGLGMRLCADPRTCVGMCKYMYVPVCGYLSHAGNRDHTTYRGPQSGAGLRCVRGAEGEESAFLTI